MQEKSIEDDSFTKLPSMTSKSLAPLTLQQQNQQELSTKLATMPQTMKAVNENRLGVSFFDSILKDTSQGPLQNTQIKNRFKNLPSGPDAMFRTANNAMTFASPIIELTDSKHSSGPAVGTP